jgi:hypothetical protein
VHAAAAVSGTILITVMMPTPSLVLAVSCPFDHPRLSHHRRSRSSRNNARGSSLLILSIWPILGLLVPFLNVGEKLAAALFQLGQPSTDRFP